MDFLYPVYFFSVTSFFLGTVIPIEDIRFGMAMVERAYNAVCWSENLRVFPSPAYEKFGDCYNLENEVIETVLNISVPGGKEQIMAAFANFSKTIALPMIPSYYKEACLHHLYQPLSSPPIIKNDILKDRGCKYPFRGFAYCLVDMLRKHHGEEAIDAVKNEKIYKRKHWKQVLLEQANKARRRHGVEPLKMKKELNRDAEFYARQMASKCVYGHSTPQSRLFHGEITGENISGRIGGDPLDVSLSSFNAYYNEIKYYPYSVPERTLIQVIEGIQSKGYKLGHFIQLIWKSTKYVGYGLSYNYNCSENTTAPWKAYYVERYYPAFMHNSSMYLFNVLPPTENEN